MYIAISEQELDALTGTGHGLTVLYLYLKRFMDYKTAIVGYERRISYQSISEALYIEPRPGVKGTSYSKQVIRRMLDQLVKLDIVKKSRKDTLVFKLHLADTSFYVQKKADRGTIPKDDTLPAKPVADSKVKADTPKKAKADTPHYFTNTISSTTTTNNLLSSDQAAENGSSSNNLIFPKATDNKSKLQMQKLIAQFNAETQQELLDEMQGYIDLKKVQSTPTALLHGLVGRCLTGSYVANYALKVKNTREQRKKQAEAVQAPKPAPTKRDSSKVVNLNHFLKTKAKA